MSAIRVPCTFCGEELDPEAVGVYRETKGWTQRQAGGRGGVRLVTYSDRWAHPWCVDAEARGVGVRQGAMFR